MENEGCGAIIFIILVILGIYFFFIKKDTWQGVFYPNGCLVCEDQYIYSPQFEDRASCIEWGINLEQQRSNPSDDFECGKNCKTDQSSGLSVCEETVDY
ncbi:hypothetical protein A2155_00690 [candidate division WWE3 bacterium RBG_16_52_45]|nr:MAG: hypothetical protein A2155_00690 [candidate division WWE3 bacterium RBG_16_52_45]